MYHRLNNDEVQYIFSEYDNILSLLEIFKICGMKKVILRNSNFFRS